MSNIPQDLVESHRRAVECWQFAQAVESLAGMLFAEATGDRASGVDVKMIDLQGRVVEDLYGRVSGENRQFASENAAENIIRTAIHADPPRPTWHERAYALAEQTQSVMNAAGVWWGADVPVEDVMWPALAKKWFPRKTKLGSYHQHLAAMLSPYWGTLEAGLRAEMLLAVDLRRETSDPPPPAVDTADGFHSAGWLAEHYGISVDALDARLRRWRKENAAGGGWMPHDSPRVNEPKYLYRLSAVLPIIQDLKKA